MSPHNSPSITPVPPPPLSTEDQSTSAAVNKRLTPPFRFPVSFSTPNLRGGISKSKLKQPMTLSDQVTTDSDSPDIQTTSVSDSQDIHLNIQAVDDGDDDDLYEWAVLYENQRGITLFSTPYYSSNSLLPSDPPPFAVPNLSQKRSHHPAVSLKEYPLPDGNWRWVSKSWMIDMRTDSGEVQHDGFEYNWVFRKHHWRAQVGLFSSGGYVRRRRWVRLMMRPGKKTKEGEESIASPTGTPSAASLAASLIDWHHRRSLPPSVPSISLATGTSQDYIELWQGILEEDWKMARYLLRMAGRDGAKLDLWRRWLGLSEKDEPGLQSGQEDDASESSSHIPPIEYVKTLLRAHAPEILESFIFPDSRARFIRFLKQVHVYDELEQGLKPSWSRVGDTGLAFWSLSSDMNVIRANGKGGGSNSKHTA